MQDGRRGRRAHAEERGRARPRLRGALEPSTTSRAGDLLDERRDAVGEAAVVHGAVVVADVVDRPSPWPLETSQVRACSTQTRFVRAQRTTFRTFPFTLSWPSI